MKIGKSERLISLFKLYDLKKLPEEISETCDKMWLTGHNFTQNKIGHVNICLGVRGRNLRSMMGVPQLLLSLGGGPWIEY